MSVQLQIHHVEGMYAVVHGTDVMATYSYTAPGSGTKAEAEHNARIYARGMVQGLELARRLAGGATVRDSVVEMAQ